jgi:hypothetical protein
LEIIVEVTPKNVKVQRKRPWWLYLFAVAVILIASFPFLRMWQMRHWVATFTENNTSSPEFLAQLRNITLFGGKLPKPIHGYRVIVACKTDSFLGENRAMETLEEILTRRGDEWCFCDRKTIGLARKINPDFVLSYAPSGPPAKGVISILSLHMPMARRRGRSLNNIARHENFIQAISDIALIETRAREKGYAFRRIYSPLAMLEPAREFCDGPKERLFSGGVNWDFRRRFYYSKLYELLDRAGYCDFYGPAADWEWRDLSHYRGLLTSRKDVLETMERAGIMLLLHSEEHLRDGTASRRIFEAAAASNVIISDRNPFIVENFGDCVLYVDVFQPVEEIFRQIDDHMRWIRENPEAAMDLARRAHAIFMEKFTMEMEVEKLFEFYEAIVAEKHANDLQKKPKL